MTKQYAYINRYYGRQFKANMRVKFTEDGRYGRVMKPSGDPQYVRVEFDDGTKGDCHPESLAIF